MSGRHTTKNAPTASSTAVHRHHRRALSALPIGRADAAKGGGGHALAAAAFAYGRGGGAAAAPTSFWKQTPPAAATVTSGSFDDYDDDSHDREVPSPRKRGACGRRQQGAFQGYFREDTTSAAAAAVDGGALDSAFTSNSIQEREDGVDNNDVLVSAGDGNLADEEDGAESDMIFDFDDL